MPAPSYQHSETFSRLKRIQETLPGNLTSVEYLRTLDLLIEYALFPILSSTRFVDTFLSKILAWQSTNPKRKATSTGKKDLPSYVVLFLISNTPDQKLKVYKKVSFDRGITLEIIRRWLDTMRQYEELVNLPQPTLEQRHKMQRVLTMLDAHEDTFPLGAYYQVKFWFQQANTWKSIILEKYTRLCLNTAQQDYVKFQHRVDLEDIVQVYLMTASKAIDRCDPNKGVLTSHIQNWLMSARNTVMKNYLDTNTVQVETDDESVDSILAVGSQSPESATFESAESKLERQGTIDRVRVIARQFDRKGYARLLMGIGEHVTPKMKSTLRQYAKKPTPQAT